MLKTENREKEKKKFEVACKSNQTQFIQETDARARVIYICLLVKSSF